MPRLGSLRRLVLVFLTCAVAGCVGAQKTSPDAPLSAGGLTPNVKDKDAGLVAIAANFDITRYKVIVVNAFPVTDPGIKDDGDRRFAAKMAPMLHIELIRRLLAGAYGAGRTRAQAETRFLEPGSDRVVIVTADRRIASRGGFGPGSDVEHLEESFSDMARDLARFLVRLSKGEAPQE